MKSRKIKKVRLICGVGINDADYPVWTYSMVDKGNGVWVKKITKCPIYDKWYGMLHRCYNEAFKLKVPCYVGVTVCDEWLYFSKFRAWVIEQEWEDLDLDKDILSNGQKIYSPDTCAFIPAMINRAFSRNQPRELPLGVVYSKTEGKFTASGGRKYLGVHNTAEDAHRAWQEAKILDIGKLIKQYSRMKCYRKDVHRALSNIAENIKLDLMFGRETKAFNNQKPEE